MPLCRQVHSLVLRSLAIVRWGRKRDLINYLLEIKSSVIYTQITHSLDNQYLETMIKMMSTMISTIYEQGLLLSEAFIDFRNVPSLHSSHPSRNKFLGSEKNYKENIYEDVHSSCLVSEVTDWKRSNFKSWMQARRYIDYGTAHKYFC